MNDSIGPSFDLVLAQIKQFSGILAGALNQYAQYQTGAFSIVTCCYKTIGARSLSHISAGKLPNIADFGQCRLIGKQPIPARRKTLPPQQAGPDKNI